MKTNTTIMCAMCFVCISCAQVGTRNINHEYTSPLDSIVASGGNVYDVASFLYENPQSACNIGLDDTQGKRRQGIINAFLRPLSISVRWS